MAKAESLLKFDGTVKEVLPNGEFRVEVDHENKKVIIRCYLSGRMRQNKIRVILGDRVSLEIPTSVKLENSVGRITYRN